MRSSLTTRADSLSPGKFFPAAGPLCYDPRQHMVEARA